MPREIIESTDVRHGDETPFGVQVGWSRDAEYVQVASVTHRQRSLWWQILASTDEPDGGLTTPPEVERRLTTLGELARRVVHQHDAVDTPSPGRAASAASDVGRDLLNQFDTTYGPMDGLYVSMDRYRINRLIRLLRKARDAAFGRDE